MSGSVDNKVVKMTFDNSSFQKNVSETMSSLDKLKAALNFDGAKKGMSTLGAEAGKVNLGPIHTQIESVNAGFLAMATVAATALSGITTKALAAGGQMVKSLSLQPITEGFQEYETNMESIQTILANTKSDGTNLEQVNAALDEMNEYSDKTIYNFSQMSKNVSKFTAAGIDLETSVSSIKGLANVAALTGVKNEEAQRAMFQLSQALSSGTVKLRDWVSVEQTGGMAGEQFQKALVTTGQAMGELTQMPVGSTFEDWTDKNGKFRDTLESGWLTADVLTTTLGAIAGDLDAIELSDMGFTDEQVVQMVELGQTALASATDVKTATQLFQTIKETIGSGWAKSFQTVIGNFVEAKALFTNLNNYIGGFIAKNAEARNKVLAEWKWFGGREQLMGGLMASLGALRSILKPVGDAFREVFPKKTAVDLYNITKAFREFAERMMLSESGANRLKQIFTGVFSIFSIGIAVIKGLHSVFRAIVSVFFEIISGFGGAAGSAGDFITKLREMLVDGGGIEKFFKGITDNIAKLGDAVNWVKEKLAGVFTFGKGGGGKGGDPGAFAGIVEKLKNLFERLGEIANEIGSKISTAKNAIGDFFGELGKGASSAGEGIANGVENFIQKITDALTSDAFAPALAAVGVGIFGAIGLGIRGFLKSGQGVFDSLKEVMAQIGTSAADVLDSVSGAVKSFQNNIRADTLRKIAIAMAILTVSLIALSFIDGKKLATALAGVAAGMAALVGSLALLAKIETNPVKMTALAISMSLVAVAAALLGVAVTIFSKMNLGDMAKGLLGVFFAMDIMARAAQVFSKNNSSFIATGFSLIIMSGALWIFAQAVKMFNDIDAGVLLKGMFTIGVILAGFALFTNLVDKDELMKLAIAFGLMVVSLHGMKRVIEQMAAIPAGELIKGLLAVGASLAIIVIAVKNLPEKSEMTKAGAGLLLIAASLWIVAEAVTKLSQINLVGLGAALFSVLFLMTIMVNAANLMTTAMPGAAAMVVMAGALWLLAEVITKIGAIPFGDLLKGLLGLAGILLILGLAAAALVAFPLLGVALEVIGTSLILIGVGFGAFGAGIYLAAKGLETFIKLGDKAGPALVDMLTNVASVVPEMAKAFGTAFVEFIKVIADKAGEIVDAMGELLTKILDKIIELAPKFGEAMNAIMDVLLTTIETQGPRLIEVGLMILTNFLTGIRDNIELITTLGLEILTNFINGMTAGLPNLAASITFFIQVLAQQFALNIPIIIQAGVDMLVAFLNGLALAIPQIATSIANVVIAFVTAVGNEGGRIAGAGVTALTAFVLGILGAIPGAITAAGQVIEDIITAFGDAGEDIVTAGKDATLSFLDGLVEDTLAIINGAGKLLLELLDGIEKAIRRFSPEIREKGKGIAGALIDGITGGLGEKAGKVIDKIKEIAGDTIGKALEVFGINSPSRVFRKIGRGLNEGLILGIQDDAGKSVNAVKGMANSTIVAFGQAMSGIDLGNMDEFNPVITPVLDLTRVSNDARSLAGMLGTAPMTASLSAQQARYLSGAQTTSTATPDATAAGGPTEIKFEQNIYAPEALTTDDIYRSTRGQIAMAKEELQIP